MESQQKVPRIFSLEFFPPRSPDAEQTFQRTLENRGVSVTLRESKGKGVDAACGQLRRRSIR